MPMAYHIPYAAISCALCCTFASCQSAAPMVAASDRHLLFVSIQSILQHGLLQCEFCRSSHYVPPLSQKTICLWHIICHRPRELRFMLCQSAAPMVVASDWHSLSVSIQSILQHGLLQCEFCRSSYYAPTLSLKTIHRFLVTHHTQQTVKAVSFCILRFH